MHNYLNVEAHGVARVGWVLPTTEFVVGHALPTAQSQPDFLALTKHWALASMVWL